MARPKFYAVKVGRGGPKIYTTWDECREATSRFTNSMHKSFLSRAEAETWLAQDVPARSFTTGTLLNLLEEESQPRPSPTLSTHSARAYPPRQPASHPSLGATSRRASPLPPSKSPVDEASISDQPLASISASVPPPLPSEPIPDPTPSLSKEQVEVLDRVKSGQNVFFTGSAGTGKSFLLRAIVDHLRYKHDNDKHAVAITASTGIASVNIDGCTVHSWSGIGLGIEDADKIAAKLTFQPKCAAAKQRWHRVQTLVLDEISMIDGALFDKLEDVARRMRGNDKPFGGIQLIICGDFAQLPPIPGRDKQGGQVPALFAFEAQSWEACMGYPVLLQKVFRQKNQVFVDMLNAMRFGRLDASAIAAFSGLSRAVHFDDGIDLTELYPTRREVESANNRRLNALKTETQTYRSHDIPGRTDDGQRVSQEGAARLLEKLIATREITLKVGAQVMLIKNLRQGILVNGTLGKVLAFCTSGHARATQTEISDEQDDQGKGKGQKRPETRGDANVSYPLVQFENGRKMLCVPAEFSILNGGGEPEARRDQVPLILAWAMSMHKSQGQTLQRVKVDLGRVFEKGQAYVALSRATTMEGLQVLNFNASRIQAHPKVVTWYARLMGVEPPREDDGLFDDEDDDLFEQMHGNW